METKRIYSGQARKGNFTCKFTVKVLVLHVVLHVCCTCVARVLHVCCTCVAWEFTGKSRIAAQWCRRARISPPWLPNLLRLPGRPRLFAKLSAGVSRRCDWCKCSCSRHSVALTERCSMLQRCVLSCGQQFAMRSHLHAKAGRKYLRKYNITFAGVNR